MTQSKAAFQRNKELADLWAGVSRCPGFDEVLIYARSAMVESGMTWEQMQGANRLISIMKSLCDAEEAPSDLPTPGLVHDIPGLISKVRAPKQTE
tara:strand:+ start:346 stop:630 length:285 start_codon:yes stop_codon:yes gene_type:complete